MMNNEHVPARMDWAMLQDEIGAEDGHGGSDIAQRALEAIIGDENIRTAVVVVLDWQPGSEVARSVLRSIHSLTATEMAYQEYRTGNPDRAISALGLIAHISHLRALDWVEEFLSDDAAAVWGVNVLDQLIWSGAITLNDPQVAKLLALMESHHDERVREKASYIREYMDDRDQRRR
ncbi:MAG: hypothetical protein ACR2JW_09795 [Thermomicrobiales bacterium]